MRSPSHRSGNADTQDGRISAGSPRAALWSIVSPESPGMRAREFAGLWRRVSDRAGDAAPPRRDARNAAASRLPRRLRPWNRMRAARAATDAAAEILSAHPHDSREAEDAADLAALAGALGDPDGREATAARIRIAAARPDVPEPPGTSRDDLPLMLELAARWESERMDTAPDEGLPPEILEDPAAALERSKARLRSTRTPAPATAATLASGARPEAAPAGGVAAVPGTDPTDASHAAGRPLPLAEPASGTDVTIDDLAGRRGSARERSRRGAHPDAEGEIPAAPDARGGGRPAAAGHRVVVPEIGDPDSENGEEVAARYAGVVGPVPVVPAPASPETVHALLLDDFPWMERAADAVAAALRLQAIGGDAAARISPMLLTGPPGCGKTAFASAVARVLGVPHVRFDAGGKGTSAGLDATPRGYRGFHPSLPVLAVHRHGVANPLLAVDEIDKIPHGSPNGNLQSVLLGMLESSAESGWHDDCLMTECDLSATSWILTGNDPDAIPPALASRVNHVRVGMPRPEDAPTVIAGMERELAAELNWPEGTDLPIADEVRRELEGVVASGRQLRDVRRALRAAASVMPADRGPLH